jgi:hypothetical protein
MFGLIFLLSFTLSIDVCAKGKPPRYNLIISVKKLSHHHSTVFDTIEITAYLVLKPQYIISEFLPEIRNCGVWINGESITYGYDHKIIISKPSYVSFNFMDGYEYQMIRRDYIIYGTNNIEGDTLGSVSVTGSRVYYTVPSFQLQTNTNENKISLIFNYVGRIPMPHGYYLFKDTIPSGFTHYIRHVEWFKDGKSILNSDKELTVTSPGKYYAKVTSNYDYPYTSDTISFTNEQLGIITDCIDELIADRNVSISKGEYGFDNELKEQLKVYPNPFTSELRFNFSVCNQLQITVELYNIAGDRIHHQSLELTRQELSSIKINLEEIPSGLYLLSLKTNEYYSTSKIIKQ